MNGYALTAPLAAGGPPGWVAWAVLGTVITVGTVLVGNEVYQASRAQPRTVPRAVPRAVPRTDGCTTGNCPRRYGVRVHAQGVDCGGTSRSTIGLPALISPQPIPTVAGVAQSNGTWALLGRRQKRIRTGAKTALEAWVLSRPPMGWNNMKTFPATDPSGGKRYDIDSFGTTNNFIV